MHNLLFNLNKFSQLPCFIELLLLLYIHEFKEKESNYTPGIDIISFWFEWSKINLHQGAKTFFLQKLSDPESWRQTIWDPVFATR